MSDTKDEASGLHPAHHRVEGDATEAKGSRAWFFNRKGFTLTWRGLLALVVTLGSTFTMGGSFLHQSLYGSTDEVRATVLANKDKLTEHERRMSVLEVQMNADRKASDEREVHTAQDIHDIRVAITHLTDHLK